MWSGYIYSMSLIIAPALMSIGVLKHFQGALNDEILRVRYFLPLKLLHLHLSIFQCGNDSVGMSLYG